MILIDNAIKYNLLDSKKKKIPCEVGYESTRRKIRFRGNNKVYTKIYRNKKMYLKKKDSQIQISLIFTPFKNKSWAIVKCVQAHWFVLWSRQKRQNSALFKKAVQSGLIRSKWGNFYVTVVDRCSNTMRFWRVVFFDCVCAIALRLSARCAALPNFKLYLFLINYSSMKMLT